VVDAKTGKDLTRVTLTQIITEDAKDKPTGLPLELLRQLIIASDEVRQEFLMWYLKSAFDTYQKLQDTVQNRLSEVQSAVLSPVDLMKRFLGATGHRLPVPAQKTKFNPCGSKSQSLRLDSLSLPAGKVLAARNTSTRFRSRLMKNEGGNLSWRKKAERV
jgi:Uncharacterized protein conserved in bacteria